MSVATGDLVVQVFTTTNPSTGAAADADVPPTGGLWVDGVANAAIVTIADLAGTGRYSFSVTMPTLTANQRVAVVVDATINGVACVGTVWEDQCAATSIAASSSDATASGAITRKRGNTWSIALTLGAIIGYTSLWFSVKNSYDDADSAAVLQVKLNNPSAADGLLYVNGAAATDSTKASITVSNAGTGAIIIAIDETITDDIAPGTYYYDAQALIAGAVTTPDSGTFTVTADVTRSVA